MSAFKSFSCEKWGVSIDYPIEMVAKLQMEMNTVVFTKENATEDLSEGPFMNLQMTTSEGLNLEKFSEISIEHMKMNFPFTDDSVKNIEMGGIPAKKFEIMNEQTVFIQQWTIFNGKAFVLTYVSKTQNHDSKTSTKIDHCFQSFKFFEPNLKWKDFCLKTHRDYMHGFSVQIPAQWNLNPLSPTCPPIRYSLGLNTSIDTSPNHTEKLNFLLVIENLSDVHPPPEETAENRKESLEKYLQVYDLEMKKQLQTMKESKLRSVSIPLISDGKDEENQQEDSLECIEGRNVQIINSSTKEKTFRIITVYDSKAYVLSLSTTSKISKEKEPRLFQRIIDSFRILKRKDLQYWTFKNFNASIPVYQYERALSNGFNLAYQGMKVDKKSATISDKKFSLKIEVPIDFKYMSDVPGFTAFFKKSTGPIDHYAKAITLTVKKIPKDETHTLSSFVDKMLQELQNVSVDFGLLERKDCEFLGRPGLEIVFTSRLDPSFPVVQKCIQRCAIITDRVFLLSFSDILPTFGHTFQMYGKPIYETIQLFSYTPRIRIN